MRTHNPMLSRFPTEADHNGFGLPHLRHVGLPGPRTVFHFKYVVLLLSMVGVFMILSFALSLFQNTTSSETQNCKREERAVNYKKIFDEQKSWFKAELDGAVIRIANLSNIQRNPTHEVKVDDDVVGDLHEENFESNSVDQEEEYAQDNNAYVANNEDDADINHEELPNEDNDMSVDINDKDQVAELKLWKKMEKENVYGIFKSLRKILNGTIEKSIPAPGTIAHDERRPLMILSSVNAGFLDFTVNWLLSMKQIGIRHNVTLVAEDPVAYEYLSKRYRKSSIVSIIPTHKNYTKSKMLGFFSRDYLKLVNRRPEYILQFLEKGIDVLHADVDEYWFRDPLDFIRAEYDIYDVWAAQGKDGPCPCFLYMKAKQNVISMVKDWALRIKRKHGSENDQQSLAHVLWRYRVMPPGNKNKIYHRKLDNDLFPTGTVFLTPSWWRVNGKRLYVAHANRLGNHEKKTAFFREYRLWLVNPYTLDLPVIPEDKNR